MQVYKSVNGVTERKLNQGQNPDGQALQGGQASDLVIALDEVQVT